LERFAFAFAFELALLADALRAFAVRGFAGLANVWCLLTARSAGLLSLTTGGGAAATGVAGLAAAAGCGGANFDGVRELDVFSGGSGCFRGRPLFRAA
jgi:hypothetical protein